MPFRILGGQLYTPFHKLANVFTKLIEHLQAICKQRGEHFSGFAVIRELGDS
jgi:hypothetical protein